MKISFLFAFLFLITSSAFADFDDIPFDDIPRPGGPDEIRRIVDEAIAESRARIQRQKEERQKAFRDGFLPGHTIEMYPDGEGLMLKRLEVIHSARRSIFLSTFIFDSDRAGRVIGHALCEKAKQGVDVRMMIDSFGAKKFYNAYADTMRECGAGILLFNPPQWGLDKLAYVIHEKLIIVDGETVMMGGAGIQNAYFGFEGAHKYFHDLDAAIQGPAACWYHRKFIETYQKARRWDSPPVIMGSGGRSQRFENYLFGDLVYPHCEETEFGVSGVNPNYANPLFQEERPIFDTYVNAFVSSSKRIKLYAPYFVPHDGYIAALLWARRQGMEVDIITNSLKSNDEGVEPLVGMVYRVGKLMKAGVRIHLWRGPKTVHRKAGVYDGKWAHIGSDNLDSRGHLYSSESVSFTDDPAFVTKLEEEFDEDMQNSDPLTRERMQEILEATSGLRRWAVRRLLLKYL